MKRNILCALIALAAAARILSAQTATQKTVIMGPVGPSPYDVVRGWQTYAVPPGITIARAQWNPSRGDRTPAAAAYNLELPR